MGEYGKLDGKEIKLGTCEDMFYLRADQASRIEPMPGNINPMSPEDQKVIRFRFPWPDEDAIEPGQFENFGRGLGLYGVQPPKGVEHHTVQFVAQAGYLVSLPCPESNPKIEVFGPDAGPFGKPVTFHRNGFAGPVKIVQQAYRNGNLALICQCGGCGAAYNLPTLVEAAPIIEAVLKEAERFDRQGDGDASFRRFHFQVAERITAGYRKAEKISA